MDIFYRRKTHMPLVFNGILCSTLVSTLMSTLIQLSDTIHHTYIAKDAGMRILKGYWRNHIRSERRAGRKVPHLEKTAQSAAKQYHDAIRKQKKTHWNDFLADNDNIWKAAKYVNSGEDAAFGKLPQLVRADGTTTTDHQEQADELLSKFFPPLPDNIDDEGIKPQREPVGMLAITLEVERQLLVAKSWKAPGEDSLPAIGWKMTWPTVKYRVLELFQASLAEGSLLRQWRHAKIIPLKKLNKENYTIAKAWRPISLLATLGKILESVVAERISHAVETHGLLSTSHFGARKQRSARNERRTSRSMGNCRRSKACYMLGYRRARPCPRSYFSSSTQTPCKGKSISNWEGIEAITNEALDWERRSGGTFEADKTAIIHFAPKTRESDHDPFTIKDRRFVAEAEAHIATAQHRFWRRAVKMWTDIHTLSETNPLRRNTDRIKKFRRYHRSPLYQVADALKHIDMETLETINLFTLSPWEERMQTDIDQPQDFQARAGVYMQIAVSSSAQNKLVE
ncbi:hypothetical protein N7537_010410 [Penicillium hordei]|uniref:Reverse transcriptase n=1 Tax=Penicillium hordei TaxID=40994 RepID=A0AAD6GVM7_9EURO|nr:uncharacterized protein N7537_010410 [Penicillium hordei]KAJ5593506.1 hypothetical protein N7537_010410 [Penicillium hordei]